MIPSMVPRRSYPTGRRGRSLNSPVRGSEGRRTPELRYGGLHVNDPTLADQAVNRTSPGTESPAEGLRLKSWARLVRPRVSLLSSSKMWRISLS